jgi:hypothetical protein
MIRADGLGRAVHISRHRRPIFLQLGRIRIRDTAFQRSAIPTRAPAIGSGFNHAELASHLGSIFTLANTAGRYRLPPCPNLRRWVLIKAYSHPDLRRVHEDIRQEIRHDHGGSVICYRDGTVNAVDWDILADLKEDRYGNEYATISLP